MRVILACTLLAALAGGLVAAGREREYRARSFVIQVPSYLGGDRGIELARSPAVLRRAVVLSGVRGMSLDRMRQDSSAEITSRLDLAFTVTAPRAEDASALATGYAKAFRQAIPDDRGLPVRGRGAGEAQGELGPLGWAGLAGFAGFGLGVALTVIRGGLARRG